MAGLNDKLYKHAPVPIQHLMVSAYGLYWNRYRFGGRFQGEYEAFISRERFTADEWTRYTEHKLRDLLVTAFQRVPYYREYYASHGISQAQLEKMTLTDLPSLPVLEKQVARDNPLGLLVDGVPQKGHGVFHTSGSTGTPVHTYWLPEERQRSLALRESRECRFAGVSYKMPRATFSGRMVEPNPYSKGPFHRFNYFEKQVYFSAFHLRPETAPQYVKALADHGTVWMNGYANSIYQLAQMVLDQKLKAPKLKAVITTSEKLVPEYRPVIEEAFQTRAYEQYGCVEDVFYACDCEHGRLHISPDAGIIEVVDEHFRPVAPGEVGEVVVTGFVRPSQMFIRYRVGDQAVLDDTPCACGRQMPILKEVVGRLEDHVYGPDGRRMVRFHGIFVAQPHVREAQVIQERLNLIRVRVVAKDGFGEADIRDITARIQQRLTDQMQVQVEVVDEIERSKAGKFRAVVSKLSDEEKQKVRA